MQTNWNTVRDDMERLETANPELPEGQRDMWRPVWRDALGYRSHASWRAATRNGPLRLREQEWNTVELDPQEVLSLRQFPYGGVRRQVFEQIDPVRHSIRECLGAAFVQQHPRIAAIRANMPRETVLTALELDGEPVLIDGFHRGCAIAMEHVMGGRTPQPLRLHVGRGTPAEVAQQLLREGITAAQRTPLQQTDYIRGMIHAALQTGQLAGIAKEPAWLEQAVLQQAG